MESGYPKGGGASRVLLVRGIAFPVRERVVDSEVSAKKQTLEILTLTKTINTVFHTS
jgi:hypothetical protein